MKRLAAALMLATLAGACSDVGPVQPDPATPPLAIAFAAGGPHFSSWSPAVSVGPPISTPGYEACPFISKDGLDLFFRKGISGRGWDIFVSHRNSPADPWGEPVNLGDNVNSTTHELCSFVTIDGHWLYFVSYRTDLGNYGSSDLFVAHRKDKSDPTGWETPKNLGPLINSAAAETGPSIFEGEATGEAVLYFNSAKSGDTDIYSAPMYGKETFGPATPVTELNTPGNDAHAFIRRRDGLELIMWSDYPYPGAQGMRDLYVSTRASTADAWSTPLNLGTNINTPYSEVRPSISWDGTTLYFWTDRNGPPDVYQATRTRLPH